MLDGKVTELNHRFVDLFKKWSGVLKNAIFAVGKDNMTLSMATKRKTEQMCFPDLG